MQGQSGFVPDRILERIPAHVALGVLVRAEGPVGVVIRAVNGRSGEAEQECVWECLTHLAPQIAFLGAVGLVGHDDNIRTPGKLGIGFTSFGMEFVNEREDGAMIFARQLLQVEAAFGLYLLFSDSLDILKGFVDLVV